MNQDLLENALTDYSLISHTSCVGWVVQIVHVSSLSVWLVFEIIIIIITLLTCQNGSSWGEKSPLLIVDT